MAKRKGNKKKHYVSYANRGKPLEILVNYECDRLQTEGIGMIVKQHVDWCIIRRQKRIVNAFPRSKAVVDYLGLYHGIPVAFDAKSTLDKTSLPLGNLKEHQVEFLRTWEAVGGIGFWLVEFAHWSKWFVLRHKDLLTFLDTEERKSIPISYFEEKAREIKPSADGFLPFLSMFDEEENYVVERKGSAAPLESD